MTVVQTIWDLFHDGSIVAARGEVPGTVELYIHVRYMRDCFEEPGELFRLTLNACTDLSWSQRDSPSTRCDPVEIGALGLQVLCDEPSDESPRLAELATDRYHHAWDLADGQTSIFLAQKGAGSYSPVGEHIGDALSTAAVCQLLRIRCCRDINR